MNPVQRVAFYDEIALAKALLSRGDFDASIPHLERAHVIGQSFVVAHATTHWLMLLVELRKGRVSAVLGQAVRLVLGIVGSALGVVPIGNTGGTNVSMFRRMPIEPELQGIIDGRGQDHRG